MDIFEKFSSKFGAWYEGLFGSGTGELRPRDVLRKITNAMDEHRKEGLDGKIYVPNKYILELKVDNPEEKDYLLSFIDEEELTAVLMKFMKQNQYNIRGPLDFTIDEIPEEDRLRTREKLRIKAKFEKGPVTTIQSPERPVKKEEPAPLKTIKDEPIPPTIAAVNDDDDDDDEPGTIPAIAWASLAITNVDGRKNHYSLTKPDVQIGRSRNAHNDIILNEDGMVSKSHARIERESDGRFTVYDLESTNGVIINEKRVMHNQVLNDGDDILIGSTHLVFQQVTPEKKNIPVADDQNSHSRKPRLIDQSDKVHILASNNIIGKAVTSDIVIDAPSVSTKHARIVGYDSSTYYIEDMGSEQGTRINGRALAPYQRALLADGDTIMLGSYVLTFHIL